MLPVLLLALAPLAHAQDCDARALRKQVADGSPVAVPMAFEKLAACDPRTARRVAPTAFERMLGGDEGYAAAAAALEAEVEPQVVRAWIRGLEPDLRSRALVALGRRCAESEAIQTFFLESEEAMGLDFWTERWHRGLTECRVEPVQALLAEALDDEELASDRRRLFNILEVYARNLRGAAIPKLSAIAGETSDQEELTYLVNAFADTTGIGSVDGMDPQVAGQAIAAIQAVGPKLPPRAVDQARSTLRALGDEQASDASAAWRWRDRQAEDGDYRYAVAILEETTCKNGKRRANLHVAPFDESGSLWPDQIQPQLQEKLVFEWELELAARCKGEPSFQVRFPDEPFATAEARQAWIDEQVALFEQREDEFQKAKVFRHEPFDW